MAFLLKNGAVFFHIPKTGGTWVKQVLEEMDLIKAPLGHPHSDWDRTLWHDKLHGDLKVARYLFRRAVRSRRAKPRMDPDCFKFCFIREPLTWYESLWRYRCSYDGSGTIHTNEGGAYKWQPLTLLDGLGSPDFNTFVDNVNRKRPGFVTEMYGWYVRPGVDFVGKTENIRHDLIKAFSLMNLEVDAGRILSMPMKNESPSHIPVPEWDPAVRKATLRLEYAGYVRFGYPVEGTPSSPALKNGRPAEIKHLV